MSRPLVGVLADDLSGAADCGVAFRAAGLETAVVIERGEPAPDCEVLVVSADSRDREESEAPGLVREAAGFLQAAAPAHWYAKVDSALRGHLAVELAALIEALGGRVALCAPAYPENGRTVRGGRGYVDGTPLEQSELWRSQELEGVADLPRLLEAGGVETLLCELSELRAGELPGRIDAALGAGSRALVCDAETDADLEAVADAGLAAAASPLWLGSAGLASALAKRLGPGAGAEPEDLGLTAVEGPVVTVVGSASAVARSQLERLATEIEAVELPVESLLEGDAAAGKRLEEALARGGDLVVAPEPPGEATPSGPLAVRLADAMGALLAAHADSIGGFVLTGGATARAVLEACDVSALRILGAIEPGVPVSVALPSGKPVITKAGSFGAPGTLAAARRALRAPTERAALAGDEA